MAFGAEGSRMAALKKLLGEKKIFVVLILVLAALTINDVIKLTLGSAGWFGYPKEAKMSINFNDSIAYPNMTFCMTKKHAWSHFSYDRQLDANESRLEFFTADGKHHKTLVSEFHGSRDAFLKEPWKDEKLIMSAYHAIAALNYLEREFDASRARYEIANFAEHTQLGSTRRLVKSWLEAIEKLNVTFADFQDKVGKEVIRRSVLMMARVVYADGPESQDFIPTKIRVTWISLGHLCFQPIPAAPNASTSTGFDPISVQGWFFKMDLKHHGSNLRAASAKPSDKKDAKAKSKKKGDGGNGTQAAPSLADIKSMCMKEERVECMTVDFHGRPTIFSRSMQGKGRVKDGIGEGLCPGDYVEVNVDIRARYTMLPNDKKPTACTSYDDDDGDTSEYLCRSRCRMEMIRELCSCTGLTFQDLVGDQAELEKYPLCDYSGCGTNASALNVTDKECADKCLPSCQQTRFRVFVDRKGHTASSGSETLPVTKLIFIWGSFEYLRLDQDLKWDWSSWMAALGGSMGMYLGLSALGLIQLCTWVAAKAPKKIGPLATTYRDKRSLSRGSSIDNTSPVDVNNNPDGSVPNRKKVSATPFGGSVTNNPLKSPFNRK